MNPNGLSLWRLIASVLGIVVVLQLLWIMLLRERAKASLREQGFRPWRVRWRLFAFWSGAYSTGFVVVYLDDYGMQHCARCKVLDRVRWIPEEVHILKTSCRCLGGFFTSITKHCCSC